MTSSRLPALVAGLFAGAIFCACAMGAPAQVSSPAFSGFQGKSKDPIQIDATTLEISETDTQRVAVFEGNVVVKRGDTTMTAAKMTVYANKATPLPGADPAATAGAAKPGTATAGKTPATAAPAGSAPAAAKTPPPKAAGAAKAAGAPADPNAPPFTRLEASGGVRVTSADQVLTGDNAVVDMTAHLITLAGNVVLSQGTNVLTGDKLIYDTQSGKARIEQLPGKQIRAVFTPKDDKPAGTKPGDSKK